MGLASRGIRVIAAESPPYWNMKEWCDGFKRLIDYLELDKVHLFGASLGNCVIHYFECSCTMVHIIFILNE